MDFKFDLTKENMKSLGIIIKMTREKNNWSLRGVADSINISHSTISEIENGKVIPQEDILKELLDVFNIEFKNDSKIIEDFYQHFNKILELIIFVDYENAKSLINELEQNKKTYYYSPAIIDYNLIRLFYYVSTKENLNLSEDLLISLESPQKFMDKKQIELFNISKSIFLLNKKDYQKALELLKETFEIGIDENLRPLVKYYLSIGYLEINDVYDAINFGDEARNDFEDESNYIMSALCMLIIGNALMKVKRYEKAEKFYQNVLNFATKFKLLFIKELVNIKYANLHYRKKDYEKALFYLKGANENSPSFYFLMSSSLVKLNKAKEALIFINQSLKNTVLIEHPLHYHYLKLLDFKINESLKFEETIIELIIMCEKNQEIEILETIYKLFIEYLSEKRRYKEALKYSLLLNELVSNH